jgi:hypothetical protein
MGYSTEFKGELKFTVEPTASQLATIKSFLGEDCRDHPEWGRVDAYYIDLEFTDDFTGLRWNGAEKTYAMEACVNVIVREVRKTWPEFGLQGSLLAQGESIEDRWALVINADGFAEKQKIALPGPVCTCPHCGERFVQETTA